MNHFKTVFAAALSALCFFLLFPTEPAFASVVDDDDEDVIELVVELPGTSGNRTIIPIQATYNPLYSCVSITFGSAIGIVTVSLTNLTTSANSMVEIDSSCGNYLIPITLGTGYYRIEFHSEDGTSYYGFFIVQ